MIACRLLTPTVQFEGLRYPLLAPEHLDARLQQLEAEQANIIRSAHHKRRPKKKNAGRQDTKTSWQQQQGPVPGEALTVLLHGYGTPTEQPAPLDLRRIDRDFPCYSWRMCASPFEPSTPQTRTNQRLHSSGMEMAVLQSRKTSTTFITTSI